MTSTTITVNGLAALSYALGEASASVDNLRKSAEAGDVSPEQAAEKLANILALLRNEIGEEKAEPVNPKARYFDRGAYIGKTENGKAYFRRPCETKWEEDANSAESIESIWKHKEISAEEGEP